MSPSNTSSTNAVTGSAGRHISANNSTSNNTTAAGHNGHSKAEAKALASARTEAFLHANDHSWDSSSAANTTRLRSVKASRQSMATKLQDFDIAFNTNTRSAT
ncbi:hypothetical protein B0J14DRAFT_555995 [Halenospora varia]|nr:hypothetical protein B0J14DRAFT_555995 [Halenospora varia]